MLDAGFDASFRDCPAKGGTGGHPSLDMVTKRKVSVLAGNQTLHLAYYQS
jgi:hypothetical protein